MGTSMNEIEYLDSVGAISVIFGVCVTVWRKLIVPINKLFITNKELVEAVKKIQSEVTTNGGKSIKDTVNSLRDICETIHYRQQIIDQRTLASLHYIDAGLFETDTSGKLIWTNEAFYKITGETQSNVEGYDWMSFIDEDDREQTINEFASCIKMARKFYIKTKDIHGKTTIFSGYPYKTGENRHGGYLINVTQP